MIDIPDWIKARQLSAIDALAFQQTKVRPEKAAPLDLTSVAHEFETHFGVLYAATNLPGDVWVLKFADGKDMLIREVIVYENRGEWLCADIKTEDWTNQLIGDMMSDGLV